MKSNSGVRVFGYLGVWQILCKLLIINLLLQNYR